MVITLLLLHVVTYVDFLLFLFFFFFFISDHELITMSLYSIE